MKKETFNPKRKGYCIIIPFSKKTFAKKALDNMYWRGIIVKGDIHKSTK